MNLLQNSQNLISPMIQKSAIHVYIQYHLLLATNRAKAVGELTPQKSEKTSEVSEQGPVAQSMVSINQRLIPWQRIGFDTA